jgi:methylated-DNA-[protein]-cysteine S-methyltransferase
MSVPAPVTTAVAVQGALATPVGSLSVAADGSGLRRVSWRHTAAFRPTGDSPADRWVQTTLDQLAEYFAGDRTAFTVPVDLSGLGAATRAVLETLRAIPAGETISYGELAARSGTGVPARAIGSIMGSNPVPIVIPCHRVVAADGLGGYSGGHRGQGRQTKLWLLEHEGALPPALL